ncbi:Isopenicillin N synthase [Cynara cardunculus var. scolymus]|uniref:Isopenicillin N synthase n=1 Tax=Cynara cardunculus var. scolymus TaxID=59895 RepID=A0A103XNL2_CYNCS|nr:Isopenicillin N synthase [Cynara cardunculus var. scolymus]
MQQSPSPESYPPCFRQNHLSNQIHSNHVAEINHDREDPLPVIDLDRIDLRKLNEACTDWGIFRLINHGIPSSLLSELHEHTVRVFDLGYESKRNLFSSIPTSSISYFWGTPALTPAGDALYKPNTHHEKDDSKNYNWVEVEMTISIKEWTEFWILLEEYGAHQARVAKSVFDSMLRNLKLGEENECCLSPSTGILRVYRYPRCYSDNPPKVWGLDVHTDSSLVTILNQDEVGGLQINSEKDDAWIDAKPIPNTLLVHLGDMMQAISDDKYKSVKHRVKVHKDKERISIGYFVFPGDDYVIRSSIYEPFTYSDFRTQVQHDIKALGAKVGLSRFKLNKDNDF